MQKLISSYQYHVLYLAICSAILWKWVPVLLWETMTMFHFACRGLGCLVFGYWAKFELNYMWMRRSLPPGDSGKNPLLGDLSDSLFRASDFFQYKMKQYGTPFTARRLWKPTVFLSKDQDVAWFAAQERRGKIVPWMPAHVAGLMGKHSIIINYGAFHRRLRRLLEPAFLPAAIQTYLPIMDRCISATLKDEWQGRKLQSADLSDLSMQLLLACVFPQVDKQLAAEIKKNCQMWLGGMAVLVPFRSLSKTHDNGWKARERLIEIVTQILESFQGAHANDQSTLLGRLCYSTDDEGKPLSREELLDNILMLFLAGHDTFGSSLGTMLHYISHLSRHQRDALQAEIEGLKMDFEELKGAPILNAFLAEMWRIDPLVSMHRGNAEVPLEFSTSTGKYHIPAGVSVAATIQTCMHDDERFPNPREFHVERFLPLGHPLYNEHYATGIDYNSLGLKYRTFGVGPHTCVGHHFAKLEARIFLVRVLSLFDVSVHSSELASFPMRRWKTEFELLRKNK